MYKVLLVDDEYMILQGLKKIIPWEELGFDVVFTAKRGKEAIGYLRDHPVDLLITDVTMPEMSGIDLLRELKHEEIEVNTLILSGYQEFEYVKQGMELGVKGYLLKPVDKDELYQHVVQIKQMIVEQERRKEQKRLYHETVLLRWLNDELSESDFKAFIKEKQHNLIGPFSVLIVNQPMLSNDILTYSREQGQPFVVTHEIESGYQTIVIFDGLRQELGVFLNKMEERLRGQMYRLVKGETVEEWDNVYESFEKAKKSLLFEEFYGNSSSNSVIVDLVDDHDYQNNFHFLSFNKALMIGDLNTMIEELSDIFEQMVTMQFTPENVRHVTFLLFTDIYRQYPSLDKEVYDVTLTKIHQSQNIHELEEWLVHVLKQNHNQPESSRRYSEVIQTAIDMIVKDYKDDLTLKNLAETLHINPVYLGQLFKKETERSFAQYLNQIRIKKAQELLTHTQLTVNEISYDVGYNNTTYFSKMFRKLNGMTPKEFRDKYYAI